MRCVYAILLSLVFSAYCWGQVEPSTLSSEAPAAESTSLNSLTNGLYKDSKTLEQMANEYDQLYTGLTTYLQEAELSANASELSVSESLSLLQQSTPMYKALKLELASLKLQVKLWKIGSGAIAVGVLVYLVATNLK